MFSVSYTAPVYSQEDEERERADLTAAEKNEVLDDVFGRNAEETAELNRREITQGELDGFQAALERIPVSDRAALMLASVKSPELIEMETAPHLFLRRDGYDVDKAAKRLAAYWDMRVEIFQEKAFLPMTLMGALNGDDDVMRMMRDYPHFRNFLPNDEHGRTVIYCDSNSPNDELSSFSRTTKLKYIWYNAHLALRRESTIQKGAVIFMSHPRNYKLNLWCDRIFLKKLVTAFNYIIPFKIRAVHIFESSQSVVSEVVFPIIKHFMNSEFRQRFIMHSEWQTNRGGMLESLEKYGFTEDILPKSFGATFVGGTYELNEDWVDEELERERHLAAISPQKEPQEI